MASTARKTRTAAPAADVVISSAGEELTAAQAAKVNAIGAAFSTAAQIPPSKAAVRAQRADAKRTATKPSTKADDRRALADRVLAHVATMELTDAEKALVANWLFGLPINRANWPAVLPKPTRGVWVKDVVADAK